MRIVVCFRETLLREALERLLTNDGGYEVLAGAPKVSTALSASRVHDARVLIAVWEGLDEEDIENLKKMRDESNAVLLIIADSSDAADKAGIAYEKFVPRHATKERLFRQINELATKEMRPRYRVAERKAGYGSISILTPREHEIALKVAEGCSNRDISYDLNLAEQTVKNMVSVIMRKMGCTNRTQVALKLKAKGEAVLR